MAWHQAMTGRMAQKLGSGIICHGIEARWQQRSQASASAPLLIGGAAHAMQ